jgi:hypothetical protein
VRTLADHDVEAKVLHRRIEVFLDNRREPMDFVDEQHVARAQMGDQACEVPLLLDGRTAGCVQCGPHLGGDDVRERGLAETRRATQQHMIERLPTHARGAGEDLQVLHERLLPHVIGKSTRPEAVIELHVVSEGPPARDALEPVCPRLLRSALAPSGFRHAICLSASRTSSPSGAPSVASGFTFCIARSICAAL